MNHRLWKVGLLLLANCTAFAAVEPVACKVVNVANDACMLLTFVGTDGTPHTIRCTADEINAYGRALEAQLVSSTLKR